jgi:hypothetical protein
MSGILPLGKAARAPLLRPSAGIGWKPRQLPRVSLCGRKKVHQPARLATARRFILPGRYDRPSNGGIGGIPPKKIKSTLWKALTEGRANRENARMVFVLLCQQKVRE